MKAVLVAAALALPLIAACAAGPASAPAQTRPLEAASEARDALAPQALAPGECGLFLFEAREPNAFVLFESETRSEARLIEDGAVVEMGVAPQSATTAPGERFRRVYLDGANSVTYTLSGRVGEETVSGQRLEDVVLRARRLDGTEIVRPLGGVRRCMARRPVSG